MQYHEPKISTARILIDADGIPGNRVDPVYHWHEVELLDARAAGARPSFDQDGLCFVTAPSCLREPQQLRTLRDDYERELVELVTEQLRASEVVVFDHTLRGHDAESRPPSHHVHCDYNATSAHKRMRELLGEQRALEWIEQPHAVVNVWRPLLRPVQRDPLGFVLPSSVAAEDWVDVEIVFPHRRGQIVGLGWNPEHRWVGLEGMRPEEAAVFTVYSSAGVLGVPHAAVALPRVPAQAQPRRSVESRMFVRWG